MERDEDSATQNTSLRINKSGIRFLFMSLVQKHSPASVKTLPGLSFIR